MAIDFSFPEETQHLIVKVREFCQQTVLPAQQRIDDAPDDRETLVREIISMRKAAKEAGLWLPHMPEEFGGMGLGHVEMAAVSAEAAKVRFGR
jgi:acyl-CoA dehydrogenase